MSGYIGNIPTPQATQTRDVFTATAGQTSFATSGYTPGFLDVYLNGVHLVNGTDYTASNGSDVVLSSGATAGDNVEVVAYTTFQTGDFVPTSGGTFAGNVAVNGNLTVDTNTLFVDAANNLVGIGTSSPSEKLHVIGNVRAGNFLSGGTSVAFGTSTSDIRYVQLSNDFHIWYGASGTERMRITSTGSVGIGTSSPSAQLELSSATDYSGLKVSGTGHKLIAIETSTANRQAVASFKSGSKEYSLGLGTSDEFSFYDNTAATERMRIDSSGALLINRTANASTFHYSAISYNANAGHRGLAIQATVQDIGTAITFYNASGTVCGSISQGTSSTSYNTSSDYRLKENVVPLAGAADRLAQIPVHRFNFIADPDRTVDGFLAHEVQEFVPECVTGTKDEVDDEGNPVYQGIDQSKLVPLLTAALQEALGRIETLEAEVAALKGEPA